MLVMEKMNLISKKLHQLKIQKTTGRKVGASFALLLDSCGVNFVANKKLMLFRGDYKVRLVEMEDGDRFAADLGLFLLIRN